MVVSNNNSAVENVAEKLNGEGLGFLVAQLGSVQNKETFIANQPEYPAMTDWKIEEQTTTKIINIFHIIIMRIRICFLI